MADDLGLPPPNVDIDETVEIDQPVNLSLNLNSNPNSDDGAHVTSITDSASPAVSSSSSSFVPIDQHHLQDAIQIINEHKEFNTQIMDYIHGATNPGQVVGNDYHIISVFGSQSTGKSTLLNRLFNTNFDVMEESRRQQTTKGIWMAYSPEVSTTAAAKPTENVFVMDVEGTDGRERGEDQDFERKAALFALATSEILIVNIWETQVGLYQGANMGLLKTVFEVNLSLFGQAKLKDNTHKVLLLIVIRDHIGVTPLKNLADTLVTDLNKMWLDLSKPSELAHLQFSDFFDVDFHALHHKVLQPNEFEADVKLLGDRLVVKKELFKPNYHHQIPIDGWTMYAESCWDQIDKNKDLDLPTQQILVAKFKCDEILSGVYEEFLEKHQGLFEGKIPGNDIDYERLGLAMVDLREDSLENYDISASRYNQSIYQQKRELLKEKIYGKYREAFDLHAKWVVESGVAQFADSIKGLRGKKGGKSFYESVKELETKYVGEINTTLALISLGELHSSDLNTDVQKRFDDVVAKQQVVELNAIVGRATSKVGTGLTKAIQQELGAPNEQTWDRVVVRFRDLVGEVKAKYAGIDPTSGSGTVADFGLGTSAEANAAAIEKISIKAWVALHATVHRLITRETSLQLLKERFEDRFRYDESGMPRLYQKVDELEISFGKARDYAESIQPVLEELRTSKGLVVPDYDVKQLRLEGGYLSGSSGTISSKNHHQHDEGDDDSDSESDDEAGTPPFSQILSAEDVQHVTNRFKREVDAQFVETKRSIMTHVTQIPYYIYLVIVVLGWNEFMAVLRNPFIFSVLLVFGAGVYALHQMSMLRPALVVVGKMADEAVVQVKKKLRDVLLETEDKDLGPDTTVAAAEIQGRRLEKIAGSGS